MKKILLGALLLLSIATYSQYDSLEVTNVNCYNDDDDDYDDDDPSAPINDYLYILAITGVFYAGKKLI